MVSGLSAYKKKQESSSRPRFYKPQDGEAVKIRFLNELDESADNFIKELGTANFVKVFTDPDNFQKTFLDTRDPDTGEDCIGYELANKYGWKKPDEKEDPEKAAAWKDWRPKEKVYINAVIDRGDGSEQELVVLELANNPKAVQYNVLVGIHEEYNTITDRWFKYSRKGSGQYDTTYTLNPLDRSGDLPAADSYGPLADLDSFVKKVPYSEQRAFLGLAAPTLDTVGQGSAVQEDAPEASEGSEKPAITW